MEETLELEKPSRSIVGRILDGLTSFFTRTKVVAKVEGPKQEIVDDIKRSFGSDVVNISHPDSDMVVEENPEQKHMSGKYVEFILSKSIGINQIENTLEKDVKSFVTVERGILKI